MWFYPAHAIFITAVNTCALLTLLSLLYSIKGRAELENVKHVLVLPLILALCYANILVKVDAIDRVVRIVCLFWEQSKKFIVTASYQVSLLMRLKLCKASFAYYLLDGFEQHTLSKA